MKKPLVVIAASVVVLALGGAAWWYLRAAGNRAEGNPERLAEGAPPDAGGAPALPGSVTAPPSQPNNPPHPPNVFANDSFSLSYPDGWRSTPPPPGVSAMLVKQDETITDPQAKKMNFHSYLSVSYGSSEGRNRDQLIGEMKTQLRAVLPGAAFSNERSLSINHREAYAMELRLSQSGADFHVWMVLVWGKGNDVWTLSFNTLENLWNNSTDSFETMARAFVVK